MGLTRIIISFNACRHEQGSCFNRLQARSARAYALRTACDWRPVLLHGMMSTCTMHHATMTKTGRSNVCALYHAQIGNFEYSVSARGRLIQQNWGCTMAVSSKLELRLQTATTSRDVHACLHSAAGMCAG